ncbi:MAG: hypothetical protein K5649_08840 [Lachnospiraceae bacterium]|nr:hypothetical protein [Lachnospiraceae bacterium]
MKNRIATIVKLLTAAALAVTIIFTTEQQVSATEATDAQLQMLLLTQTPEYQAALAMQQAQLAQIAAQQEALLKQQAALLAAQQAAALAAQQAAWNAQLAAAQQVYANAQYLHAHAINQAYLLNSTQAMQRAQYESMINKMGLDYKKELMNNFKDAQYDAIRSFMGYNGL